MSVDLEYLMLCPSCGKPMREDSKVMRIEYGSGVRVLERLLICPNCKVKIREVVYLR
ncbi:Zn finger protein [Thermoproteus tenax]|uniref:Zn finger protein n=1 Tax=Thermoproteus tenax (strain ATCC 35583 / DSM 2078 / JCM 9277 / NBRC 100435 / Kra 1) TaxID=768679 RepID=G4RL75_THETK|nr:Zn finger protein [Thermoproteus tenax]CCC82320.1 Zn finger protein [Thermoproteus tenax Kra 1]